MVDNNTPNGPLWASLLTPIDRHPVLDWFDVAPIKYEFLVGN
jgi:hypothetical protein